MAVVRLDEERHADGGDESRQQEEQPKEAIKKEFGHVVKLNARHRL